jgi:hypothetical protein
MGGGGTSYGDQTGLYYQMLQANDARARENMREGRVRDGRAIIDRQFSQLTDPNDTFYRRYKQSAIDTMTPQINRQYADANKELTYRLADAGTLKSSGGADATADLLAQKDAATVSMNQKADNAAADLRTRVMGEKQNAENQLYSTFDPDMALTSSLNSVQNLRLADPDLTGAMSNLFSIGTSGMANALKAMQGGGGMGNFSGGGLSSPGLPSSTGRQIGG